jgi:hypothetical protein
MVKSGSPEEKFYEPPLGMGDETLLIAEVVVSYSITTKRCVAVKSSEIILQK